MILLLYQVKDIDCAVTVNISCQLGGRFCGGFCYCHCRLDRFRITVYILNRGGYMSKQKKIRIIASNLLIKVTQLLRMFLPPEGQKKVRPFCLTKFDLNLQNLMLVSGEHDGNLRRPSIVFLKSLALPRIRNYWKLYRT